MSDHPLYLNLYPPKGKKDRKMKVSLLAVPWPLLHPFNILLTFILIWDKAPE